MHAISDSRCNIKRNTWEQQDHSCRVKSLLRFPSKHGEVSVMHKVKSIWAASDSTLLAKLRLGYEERMI